MTDSKKQEYTLRIANANRSGLTLIVYEMLFDYLAEVKENHAAGNLNEYRSSIRKVNGCLKELLNSLDYAYELSQGLGRIYLYAVKEMTLMDVKSRPEHLEEIEKMLRGLYESFRKVSETDQSAPLMKNTQEVYAGLTYGRNTLTNSTLDMNNRGMSV